MELKDFDICLDNSSPANPKPGLKRGSYYITLSDRRACLFAATHTSGKLVLVPEPRYRQGFVSEEAAIERLLRAIREGNFNFPPTTGEAPPADPRDSLIYQALARHFVCMSGTSISYDLTGNRLNEEAYYFLSGFLCAIGKLWVIITAGHEIKRLLTGVENGTIKLEQETLIDSFGPNVVSNMPMTFSLQSNKPVYSYDEINELDPKPDLGLDFAMFALDPQQTRALKANGRLALGMNAWRMSKDAKVSFYHLFGIPLEYSHTVVKGHTLQRKMKPIGIQIDRLEDDTTNVFTRFHGHVPQLEPFSTIQGWSGGPIFAFVERDGEFHYYAVAVQSRWRAATHEVWACPVDQIIALVVDLLVRHHLRNASDPLDSEE